jgi:hypothetical protein
MPRPEPGRSGDSPGRELDLTLSQLFSRRPSVAEAVTSAGPFFDTGMSGTMIVRAATTSEGQSSWTQGDSRIWPAR